MATKIKTLEDLFVHTLQDIYYAEHQIIKALPTMIEKASNPKLKQGFTQHLEETREQVNRLDQVFKTLGVPAKGVTCQAIEGILTEAKEVMSEISDKTVLDIGMAASAQAVEHYEMSRYGTLIALAQKLGHQDCVALLQKTLAEEKEADRKLTDVSETVVSKQAA